VGRLADCFQDARKAEWVEHEVATLVGQRVFAMALGYEAELYRFEDHDGFDGLMFGRSGAPYHFEFTRARKHPAGRAPSQDHLVVFYLSDDVWRAAVAQMRAAGFEPLPRCPA